MNKLITISVGINNYDGEGNLFFEKTGKAVVEINKISGVIDDGNGIMVIGEGLGLTTDKEGMIKVLRAINGK